MIFASTPATGSPYRKGPGFYLAAGVGWGRVHEANPILVDVRRYRAERARMNNPKGWAHIRRVFSRAALHGAYVTNDWERISSPEHIEHARRVIDRLARLEAE